MKNNSLFHAKVGWNGCPGCKATFEGGQGRSARSKDWAMPLFSVISELGSKDAIEVGDVEVKPHSLLMVTEKNRAYALGYMLGFDQKLIPAKVYRSLTGLAQGEL